jgi:hypothetical protein
MVTKELGIHFGYSTWDPNTDSVVGKNDAMIMITPGITYYWAKMLRTQVEVQLETEHNGVDGHDANFPDSKYTNFVVQTVLIW